MGTERSSRAVTPKELRQKHICLCLFETIVFGPQALRAPEINCYSHGARAGGIHSHGVWAATGSPDRLGHQAVEPRLQEISPEYWFRKHACKFVSGHQVSASGLQISEDQVVCSPDHFFLEQAASVSTGPGVQPIHGTVSCSDQSSPAVVAEEFLQCLCHSFCKESVLWPQTLWR